MYSLSDSPHRGRVDDLTKVKAYSGKLKSGAQKRLLSSLDLLVQRAEPQMIYSQKKEIWYPFRTNFITLTLTNSQRLISAKEGYASLLRPWLRYMKTKCGLKDYVWKAELQKNGQLHYHLASSTFLPQNLVRWKWNKVSKKAGLLDTFARQYGHFNPPSTEIKAITNVKDAKSYIAKEFQKKVQNKISVKGKVFDCNEPLKRNCFSELLDNLTWYNLRNAVQNHTLHLKELDNCIIYNTTRPLQYVSPFILKGYSAYINQ